MINQSSKSYFKNKYLIKVVNLDIINIKLVQYKIKQYTGFTPMTKGELKEAIFIYRHNKKQGLIKKSA